MTDKLEIEDDGDNAPNENGNNEKNDNNDKNEKKKTNSNNNDVEMNEFEENDDENENENSKQKPRYRRRKVREMSRDDRDESTIAEKARLMKNPKRMPITCNKCKSTVLVGQICSCMRSVLEIYGNVCEEWKCPNCSLTNQPVASTCVVCGTFRPPAAITSNDNNNNNNNNNNTEMDNGNDQDKSNEELLSNYLSLVRRNSNLGVSNVHGNNNYNNNNNNGNDDDDNNGNRQMKSSHSSMHMSTMAQTNAAINDSLKTMGNAHIDSLEEHERSILLQFVEYTDATSDVGLKFLTRTGWDIQKGLALYFDENPNPSKSRQASQAFGVDDITKLLEADAGQIADDHDEIKHRETGGKNWYCNVCGIENSGSDVICRRCTPHTKTNDITAPSSTTTTTTLVNGGNGTRRSNSSPTVMNPAEQYGLEELDAPRFDPVTGKPIHYYNILYSNCNVPRKRVKSPSWHHRERVDYVADFVDNQEWDLETEERENAKYFENSDMTRNHIHTSAAAAAAAAAGGGGHCENREKTDDEVEAEIERAVEKDKQKALNKPNESNEAIDGPVEPRAPNAPNAADVAAAAAAAAVAAEESQTSEFLENEMNVDDNDNDNDNDNDDDNDDDDNNGIAKEKDNLNEDYSEKEYNGTNIRMLSKTYSIARGEAATMLELCNGDIELAKQKLTKKLKNFDDYKSKQKEGMKQKNKGKAQVKSKIRATTRATTRTKTSQSAQKGINGLNLTGNNYLKNGSININNDNSTGTIHKYKDDKDDKNDKDDKDE